MEGAHDWASAKSIAKAGIEKIRRDLKVLKDLPITLPKFV
jgi:hypothetical protein